MTGLVAPCSKLHDSWTHETASLSEDLMGGQTVNTHYRSTGKHLVLQEVLAKERKEARNDRKMYVVNVAKRLL